jgi:hypothetical protein
MESGKPGEAHCDVNVDALSFERCDTRAALELSSFTVDGRLHRYAESAYDGKKRIHSDVDLCRAKICILQMPGTPPTGTTDLTGPT